MKLRISERQFRIGVFARPSGSREVHVFRGDVPWWLVGAVPSFCSCVAPWQADPSVVEGLVACCRAVLRRCVSSREGIVVELPG